MSTDGIGPTRTPGIAGDADTGAPHPQAPEDPDASGAHSAPRVSPSSPRGENGPDPRRRLVAAYSKVDKAVVGQEATMIGPVITLLAGGHVLLEGAPDVTKILLVRLLAIALDLETKRIQFTPDPMPGDVINSLIYDSRNAQFLFRAGPVFTNLLLADEISCTPPKTQSALLEVMEKRRVSTDGGPRALPDPFTVITTQSPIEYEGTYPLPKVQLDRFLLKLVLPLPERAQEIEVLLHYTSGFDPHDLLSAGLRAVAEIRELAQVRTQTSTTGVMLEVLAYMADLVRTTRSIPSVALGVSPRGATTLLAVSRAWAWLASRSLVAPDDVKALALLALRHHIKLRAEAEMEGTTPQSVIEVVLRAVPIPH